ncbi:MAG: hypothetical protein U1E30_03050 [Rhodoblastus sp.]
MITWGLISAAMALVKGETKPTSSASSSSGLAEAGFFPGIILYLTYCTPRPSAPRWWACSWSPCRCPLPRRAAVELISNAFTRRRPASWQWLFIIEVLPAVVMGFVVFFISTTARLTARLMAEERQGHRASRRRTREPRGDPQVLARRGAVASARQWSCARLFRHRHRPLRLRFSGRRRSSGVFGLTIAQTGWVVAIPAAGAAVMVPRRIIRTRRANACGTSRCRPSSAASG